MVTMTYKLIQLLKQQTRTTTSSQPINDTQPANKSNKTQPSKPNHHTNQPTPNQKQPIIRPPGCLRYTKLCWVGKHVNMIMKPTNSPTQGPTQPKNNQGKSGIWATFSQKQIFFRGMGLILHRKQTTRNPTQSNPPQTP